MVRCGGHVVIWFASVALLLLHQVTCEKETGAPSFGSNDKQEIVAAVGREAVFRCTVKNIKQYQTAWLEMKKGIVFAMGEDLFTENPRVSVHHSLTLSGDEAWILTIKDVTEADAGDYMCSVNTAVSLRKYYRLKVVVPPKILDANTSRDTEVREGGSARLVCSASGHPEPTYKWRREDSRFIGISGNNDLLVEGSELVFEPVRRHHSGAYLCIASNQVPPSVSKRITLNVRFKPEVRVERPQEFVTLGNSVNLSCVVDGYPEPHVQWIKRNNEVLSPGPYVYHLPHQLLKVQKYVQKVHHVNTSRLFMLLSIANVQGDDLLDYRCSANNSEGSAKAHVNLSETPTTTTTTTTTTSTTTTTTTSTSSTTTTSSKSAIENAEDNLVWPKSRDGRREGSGLASRHTSSSMLASLKDTARNASAGGGAADDLLERHNQQRKQQGAERQLKKQYERKMFPYAGNSAGISGGHSLPSFLPRIFLLLLLHFIFSPSLNASLSSSSYSFHSSSSSVFTSPSTACSSSSCFPQSLPFSLFSSSLSSFSLSLCSLSVFLMTRKGNQEFRR